MEKNCLNLKSTYSHNYLEVGLGSSLLFVKSCFLFAESVFLLLLQKE